MPFEVSCCQDEERQLMTFWISPRSVEAFTAPVVEHHPLVGSPLMGCRLDKQHVGCGVVLWT